MSVLTSLLYSLFLLVFLPRGSFFLYLVVSETGLSVGSFPSCCLLT